MAESVKSALELIVICMLLIAVATGLASMGRHREFFSHFRVRDIFAGRLDALFYVLNTLSTATAVITVVLRIHWTLAKGWSGIEMRWAILVLTMHFFTAISLICYHLITYKVLNNKEFCQMCRRRM